jgi:hypothetical protein
LLKHRFQKLLPELSGARSVAPLAIALGAMSFLNSGYLSLEYRLQAAFGF